MQSKFFVLLAFVAAAALFLVGSLPNASADSNALNFESYSLGNINGQDGWTKTGSYDVAVVNNTYGFASFGSKSLRISDGVTTGSFGDQTFAKPLVNAVGETSATAGAFSVGTRQGRFDMQFDIASTMPSQQPGLHLSVSPDRGDGSRMSYLRFEDGASGINVFFDDVTGTSNPANFNETQIATGLSRTVTHRIRLTMDTLDGPSNDVVQVYIDGTLVITGTSWENYYRYDSEAAPESTPRIVKTVLFRESGDATPADLGNGFLIDNLTQSSGPALYAATTVTVTPSSPHGWFFYDDDFPGGIGNFVAGPATPPLGTGSAHFVLPAVPGTARQAITTLAYAGTRLNQITGFQYSTYRSALSTGNESIYLQFDVDYDASDANFGYQGRLVFLPFTAASVPANTWQTWNPMTAGKWYSSRAPFSTLCPQTPGCTWAQVLANWPNAGIMANTGWLHLKAGGPAAGFDGNVDAFTIGVNHNNTTFDFEPGTGPALVFVPDSAKIPVGGSTVIGINLNDIVDLYGYQFQVNYDASKVNATATFGEPTFHFFVTAPPAVIPGGYNAACSAGVCKFAVSHVAPQTSVTGSGPLALITLTGVLPGTFNLTFSGDTLANINGGAIAHSIGTSAITVYGSTTVSGVVALQGRATPIDSGTVTLTDLGGNFPTLSTTFDPTTGAFSFSNVPAMPGGSNYQFDAAHSLYLGNRQTQTLNNAVPYAAPTTTLKGGDANNDATIDVLDLSCIGGAFGGPPTVCGATGSSDINASGDVNILDLVLAGGNYGLSTPEPW